MNKQMSSFFSYDYRYFEKSLAFEQRFIRHGKNSTV